jgi:hypothetical protein
MPNDVARDHAELDADAPAEAQCTHSDRVQDRLRVGLGAGDDAQDFGRGGLLLQRLGQRLLRLNRASNGASFSLTERGNLRLQLRDPRVAIVRHHVHSGYSALLRDGGRIARGGIGDL